MPSLIDLRRRIRSVRSTQQITKAMKMVSAARLRRAQDRVISARPYSATLRQLMSHLAALAASDERIGAHPLLAQREEKRIQLLVLTSDRGLAGAFNSNLIKAAQRFVEEHSPASVEFELIGRKGCEFFRKARVPITGEHIGVLTRVDYRYAASVGQKIADRFAADEIDAAYLLNNEFKSVVAQKLTIARLLPITVEPTEPQARYIFEQPPAQILAKLLPRYVETEVYRAMLETAASEHAARMTAMDAATSNAAEMIDKLTLYMNRVRQASITKEIIEVVSGAAGLE